MSLSHRIAGLVAGIAFALSGCQHGLSQPSSGDEQMKITVLEQPLLCPIAKSGITEITSSKQWSGMLGSSPFSQPVVLSKAWFEQYRLFAVSFGSKPTAGYSVKVNEQASYDAAKQTLHITASLQGPPAGSMTAQVITSPCVLVGAPKGDYQAVLITE